MCAGQNRLSARESDEMLLCRLTTFVEQRSTWYDSKTKQQVLTSKVFEKIEVSKSSEIIFLLATVSVGV